MFSDQKNLPSGGKFVAKRRKRKYIPQKGEILV